MDGFTSPVQFIKSFLGLLNKHQVAVGGCGLSLYELMQQQRHEPLLSAMLSVGKAKMPAS
jgi:hypothetical protein